MMRRKTYYENMQTIILNTTHVSLDFSYMLQPPYVNYDIFAKQRIYQKILR